MEPNEETNSMNRVLISEAMHLYSVQRDIEGFLLNLHKYVKSSNRTYRDISLSLGFGKNVIQSWLSKEKTPSKKAQVAVCEAFNIPYNKKVLTPNNQGEYPCGIRICKRCKLEFLVYKKTNYLKMYCSDKCRHPV